MKTKTKIKNLSREELEAFMSEIGEPRFRAKQIAEWLYSKNAASFDDMSNLPKTLRDALDKKFAINSLRTAVRENAADGTTKFAFELSDGARIESVLIPSDERITLCVSSQAGCKRACRFCATGALGFTRNLQPAEIIDQFLEARRAVEPDRKITNLVFMGMGEPFDNFANLVKALTAITSKDGCGVSPRRITVSTVGITDRFEEFGRLGLANLAISLNAPDDKTRALIMPSNKKYPIHKIVDACREYPLRGSDRITFEYVLLAGINDSEHNAHRLSGLLSGIPCRINLIPFNEFPGSELKRPNPDVVEQFRKTVLQRGLDVFVRRSRGQEISAACGRLGGRRFDKEEE